MRISNGLTIGSLAGALFCASPVLAADWIGDNGNTEGVYIGAGVGDFSADLDSVNDVDNVNLDFGNQDATRIYAGWRFNQFLAAELDYTDFGNSSNPSVAPSLLGVTTDSNGWTPSIVGTLPIGPVELFAKAGMIFYNVDVNTNADGLRNAVSDSGHDAVYGVGIGATVIERLNIRAEYERYNISSFNDANAVWLSANWRF